jgi:peroxiredoxin
MTPTVDRRHFGQTLLALAAPLAWAAPVPLLLAGCGQRESAPEVLYTLLDGRAERLSSLRNRVVLVNFWATSCATCVQEMPALVDTWRRFSERGYDTLAVAMRHDPPALVARFAETTALPFGVVIDNTGAVARAFGDVRVTPTTFVIDKRGRIASRDEGAPDFAKLHRLVDGLLAEPA